MPQGWYGSIGLRHAIHGGYGYRSAGTPYGGTSEYKSSASKSTSRMARGGSKTSFKRRRPKRRFSRRLKLRRSIGLLAPAKKLVRLKSCFNVALGVADGSLTPSYVCLNALSDSRQALGAEQPLGYDQYAALYQKYTVIGFKAYATFANHAVYSTVVGLHIATNNNGLTAYEHYRELPHTAMKVLTSDIDHTTLVLKGSTKKFFPIKLMSEDEANGTLDTGGSGVDPSSNYSVWLHIFAQHIAKSAEGTNLTVVVTIERIAVLWDRVTPARSTD